MKNLAALIYGRQIRVLSGGSRWVSALPTQQSQALRITIRNADRLRPPKGPGELAMPVLCLRCVASAAASGTGHCPALTLSNAVLWFASEVDTFLAIQLLVGAGRRGQLQLNHEISRKVVPRARRG